MKNEKKGAYIQKKIIIIYGQAIDTSYNSPAKTSFASRAELDIFDSSVFCLSLAEDSSIVLETTCTDVFSLVDVSISKFLNYIRFLSSFVLDSLSTILLTID